MTREEHRAAIQSLLGMVAPENQAGASEILTTLSEDYETTLTTSERAATDIERLTANNEKLREVNASLFLRVGQTTSTPNNPPPKVEEPEMPQLSFEALFNEKGELL